MFRKINLLSFLIVDILLIVGSYYIALWARFDGNIESIYFDIFKKYIVLLIIIKVIVFAFFKLYRSLWEYAGVNEIINILAAVILSNTVCISFLVLMKAHLPRSVYLSSSTFDLLFIGGVRLLYRGYKQYGTKKPIFKNDIRKNVLLVGAGDAGAIIVKELKLHSELNYNIVGIVDDEPEKKGKHLNGITIVGNTNNIDRYVTQYKVDEIIIAIPSASREEVKRIVNLCKKTNVHVKILPGVYELIDEKVTFSQIREVKIEDLLGREPIHLETELINGFLKHKRIMITGGGGSIGSELCRQILWFQPDELIIVDIYENNIYELQHELVNNLKLINPDKPVKLKAIVASVRDKSRMKKIILEEKPNIIFHAAAHKHVPLMEENPYEAVKNNIVGTYNMASLADELKLEKFVLISTDKAVNPTNVMGATKRFCERLVQAYTGQSSTEFVAVRFGNVLGSNGSVIPLFKSQIARGGPVTVTHKEITRYFMTIPEASQLVLQAGAMANGGEIFVLDMGESVKIYDLAKDIIKLSGLTIGEDIDIQITGLRPGEKLYEELLMDEEGLEQTRHEKIFIGKPLKVDLEKILNEVIVLDRTADIGDNKLLVTELKQFIPTFKSNDVVNDSYLKEGRC